MGKGRLAEHAMTSHTIALITANAMAQVASQQQKNLIKLLNQSTTHLCGWYHS